MCDNSIVRSQKAHGKQTEREAIMRRILTIKQAAQLIEGLTEYRIRQMCKSGQLRSFKAGNKYLIAEEDLYETVFGRTVKEEQR